MRTAVPTRENGSGFDSRVTVGACTRASARRCASRRGWPAPQSRSSGWVYGPTPRTAGQSWDRHRVFATGTSRPGMGGSASRSGGIRVPRWADMALGGSRSAGPRPVPGRSIRAPAGLGGPSQKFRYLLVRTYLTARPEPVVRQAHHERLSPTAHPELVEGQARHERADRTRNFRDAVLSPQTGSSGQPAPLAAYSRTWSKLVVMIGPTASRDMASATDRAKSALRNLSSPYASSDPSTKAYTVLGPTTIGHRRAGGRSIADHPMTTKDRLHQLVDGLPAGAIAAAADQRAQRGGPP